MEFVGEGWRDEESCHGLQSYDARAEGIPTQKKTVLTFRWVDPSRGAFRRTVPAFTPRCLLLGVAPQLRSAARLQLTARVAKAATPKAALQGSLSAGTLRRWRAKPWC